MTTKTYRFGDIAHRIDLYEEDGRWYVKEFHNGKHISWYAFDTKRHAQRDYRELCAFFNRMTAPKTECATCNPALR